MEFSQLKSGQRINYIGDTFAFGGEYTLILNEETYMNKADCPIEDRGKLTIIEFMNDETPVFFTLDKLNPNDWELVL